MSEYLKEPSEPSAIKVAMSKAAEKEEKGLPVVNFASGNVGQMPLNLEFMKMNIDLNDDLPEEIKPLTKAIKRGVKKSFERPRGLTYSATGGTEKQRKSALEYFKEFHGVSHNDPDKVIVTAGGQRAMSAALRSIKPGTNVYMSKWEYAAVSGILNDNGCKVTRISPENELGLDIEELKEKVSEDSVFYLNMPKNPTGYVSPDLLKDVAEIMVDNNGGVIWDAPYLFTMMRLKKNGAEFDEGFLDSEISKFQDAVSDYSDNIVQLSSISKTTLSAGLRYGFATGPDEWIQNMNNIIGREDLSSPTASFLTGEEVLKEFLKNPVTYKWLTRILADRLSYLMEQDVPMILPDNGKFGALYAMVKTGDLEGEEFIEKADEFGIVPIPGKAFYGEPVNAIRISLVATPWSKNDEQWKENVRTLKKAIKDLTN